MIALEAMHGGQVVVGFVYNINPGQHPHSNPTETGKKGAEEEAETIWGFEQGQ